MKKAKLEKIARETAQLEKSFKKTSKKKKGSSENVTVASLRKMDHVVEEVDRLMDKSLKLAPKAGLLSSGSDSEGEFASPDYSGDEKRRRESPRSERSHRSGKSKTVTSYVRFPQERPHSQLSLHFVNREKKYEELSIAEFCAGYSTILEMSRGVEKKHRLSHFKELMYLATKYTWKSVLSYHAACLMEIERGHLKWGSSFLVLQSTTLAGGSLIANQGGSHLFSLERMSCARGRFF